MDSLNRIFQCIHEAKKGGKAMIPKHHEKAGGKKSPKGKENPYDSDSFGMKAESSHLSPKQRKIASLAGKPNEIDAADLAEVRRRGRKKKVNASTEVANILNLIKEAYQDELISEEAFLAIADPIMRSLMEVTFPDTFEKEGLDDAEEEDAKAKDKKPSPPKNPKKARSSFHRRIKRPQG